jgi:hypothetical protein
MPEESSKRSEAAVTRRGSIAPPNFKMREERHDRFNLKIFEPELIDRAPFGIGQEAEEQP